MKLIDFLKNVKLILMMICSIIGVGFVSGSEIFQFYVRFGNFAYLGVIVFFVLMFLMINKIFKDLEIDQNLLKMKNNIKNTSKNTFITKFKIKSFLIHFNILLVASAMFAGMFSLILNIFNKNHFIIALCIVIVIFLVLYFGVRGLEKFDYVVLILLMVVSVIFVQNIKVDFKNIDIKINKSYSLKMMFNSVVFAMLYVFMNVIQIQPIIAELKPQFKYKDRRVFAFKFSLILTLILLLFVIFLKNNLEYSVYEMPFLMFFKTQNKMLFVIFLCGLIMALMSSLLSCLIGVKNAFKKFIKSDFFATIGAIILSVILSVFGFSNFVKFIYPVIGIVNFIIFVFL